MSDVFVSSPSLMPKIAARSAPLFPYEPPGTRDRARRCRDGAAGRSPSAGAGARPGMRGARVSSGRRGVAAHDRPSAMSLLSEVLTGRHPSDVAEVLGRLRPQDRVAVFRAVSPSDTPRVLAQTDRETTRQLITALTVEETARLLDRLPMDDAAEILSADVPDRREELLAAMSETDAQEVEISRASRFAIAVACTTSASAAGMRAPESWCSSRIWSFGGGERRRRAPTRAQTRPRLSRHHIPCPGWDSNPHAPRGKRF